jgi:glucosyl-dolichyl phosphate glucuronosyltransferase
MRSDEIMNQVFPNVSVIIPSYNRAGLLGQTIESFVNQNYPGDKYEIIIADNNSSDDTAKVARDWQSKSRIKIGYLLEERQGVHFARNSAAKVASGKILYFTDDDMIADPDLLIEIVKPFGMDRLVATATGKVLPKWEKIPPAWVRDLCSNSLLSLQNKTENLIIAPNDIGVFSCHQAIRKSVLFEAGGFNPENTAGVWIGDGETGLNIKIKALGYRFAYIGSSVIYHIIPPSRMTQTYLNTRLGNQGNCDSYTEYRANKDDRMHLCRKILSHIKGMVKRAIMTTALLIVFKQSWRINRALLPYYANRIKYDLRLIRDEQWRELVLKYNWIEE